MSGTVVVSAGRVGDPAGGSVTLPAVWTLADVAAAAGKVGATTVLVHSAAGFGGEVCGAELTGSTGGDWRYRLEAVDVVFLERDEQQAAGPFDGLTAGELCRVLLRLEQLLGVPWASSVGRTAERLILSTHPRAKGGTLLDRAPVTPDPCRVGNLELDWVSWRRPLTAGEREAGRWGVHVFDANAQHLGAWSTVQLGHGTPLHVHGHPFDAGVCGVWRFPGGLDGLEPVGAPLLPAPWLPGREWFTTPTVVRALEVTVGLDFPTPAEAWVWPSRTRFLRSAGERLRDARKVARTVYGESLRRLAVDDAERFDLSASLDAAVVSETALEAVKAVYSRQAGRFGMARAGASAWARPDWGHLIRATARTNLHRRLARLTRAPFAIATDAAAFVTDEPDAALFAQSIGLPVGDGLGEFKWAGSCEWASVDELERARPREVMAACHG